MIIGPRNFYTKRIKNGHADDVYFSRPSYVCTGDPFKAAAMESMRTNVKDGFKLGGHDKNFNPAKKVQEKLYKSSFAYIPEGEPKKKNYKDAEGAVIVGPKNFVTSPIKKGRVGRGTSLGGLIPYKEDEYDIKRIIAKKEREYH